MLGIITVLLVIEGIVLDQSGAAEEGELVGEGIGVVAPKRSTSLVA